MRRSLSGEGKGKAIVAAISLKFRQRRAQLFGQFDGALDSVIDPRIHAACGCDQLIGAAQKKTVAHLKTAIADLFNSYADVDRRRVDDLAFEITRGRDQRRPLHIVTLRSSRANFM